jgi:hypothetical protein
MEDRLLKVESMSFDRGREWSIRNTSVGPVRKNQASRDYSIQSSYTTKTHRIRWFGIGELI